MLGVESDPRAARCIPAALARRRLAPSRVTPRVPRAPLAERTDKLRDNRCLVRRKPRNEPERLRDPRTLRRRAVRTERRAEEDACRRRPRKRRDVLDDPTLPDKRTRKRRAVSRAPAPASAPRTPPTVRLRDDPERVRRNRPDNDPVRPADGEDDAEVRVLVLRREDDDPRVDADGRGVGVDGAVDDGAARDVADLLRVRRGARTGSPGAS